MTEIVKIKYKKIIKNNLEISYTYADFGFIAYGYAMSGQVYLPQNISSKTPLNYSKYYFKIYKLNLHFKACDD